MWVSGSYIRHQGQSLKRLVNLQTDIRGRRFSCTGRDQRGGLCCSAASSSVKHERNRQLGQLSWGRFIVGFVTHIDLRAGAQTVQLQVLKRRAGRGGESTDGHKGLYVSTSKSRETRETALPLPVNCFMVLAICPCASIFMALKYHWVDSERRGRRMTVSEGSRWKQQFVQSGWFLTWCTIRCTAQTKQMLFTCLRLHGNFEFDQSWDSTFQLWSIWEVFKTL